MLIRELSIPDAFEITTQSFQDERGLFLESFRADKLAAATGRAFTIKQVNTSVSHRGVLRGIHFAEVPTGQAKYVTVHTGSIIDYVVDIRVDSPTFGQWTSVHLDAAARNAVFVSEGLGHAFLALEDNTLVSYLVSEHYQPTREHGIHPEDSTIGLEFPADIATLRLSDKDAVAPSLNDVMAQGVLPTWQACNDLYSSQTQGATS